MHHVRAPAANMAPTLGPAQGADHDAAEADDAGLGRLVGRLRAQQRSHDGEAEEGEGQPPTRSCSPEAEQLMASS